MVQYEVWGALRYSPAEESNAEWRSLPPQKLRPVPALRSHAWLYLSSARRPLPDTQPQSSRRQDRPPPIRQRSRQDARRAVSTGWRSTNL